MSGLGRMLIPLLIALLFYFVTVHPLSARGVPMSGRGVPVVRFQAQGLMTTSSYMDAGQIHLPAMDQMTLCSRIRFHQFAELGKSAVLSYFLDPCDNELYIKLSPVTGEIAFECCNFAVRETLKIPQMQLFTWHHFCLAINLKDQVVQVVVNDYMTNTSIRNYRSPERKLLNVAIREGGYLVLGQDQDKMAGGFDVSQVLNADLAELMFFNVSLSVNQMKNYVGCQGPPNDHQPLFQFDDSMAGLEAKGSTVIYNLTSEELCTRESLHGLILFPVQMDFEEATNWCELLGGFLFVPSNAEENVLAYKLSIEYEDQCIGPWATIFWLGLRGNLTTGKWHKLSDSQLPSWDNFSSTYSKAEPNCLCTSMGSSLHRLTWFCGPCSYSTCPLCHFDKPPILSLRGPCVAEFDDTFTVKVEAGKTPEFLGFFKNRIFLDGEVWKMESTIFGVKSSAVMMTKIKNVIPLGSHQWNITSDKCGNFQGELILTACQEGEYTCDNGKCVHLAQRCDQRVDCDDGSDEEKCSIVVLPPGYSRELTPPTVSGTPLLLYFSQEVASVRQFDLVGFEVGLDVIQRVKWRDARVSFQNLRLGNFSNKVKHMQELWLPRFSVKSISKSSARVVLQSETLLVQRDQDPLPVDVTRIREDKMYTGDNNTMMLVQQGTVTFTCQFRLSKYPFDSQRCALLYNLPHVGQRVSIHVESVQFKGEHVLLEYEVVGVKASTYQTHEQSVVKVEVEFRNQYSYYVGNAFLPSVLLVIICYLTFWFRLDDFQDRIMVSLTSLLVLTGLLTQTSQSIPKTAYLKLIDVWYVVLICVDFIIIVVLVVIEGLRRQVRSSTEKVKRSKFNMRAFNATRHPRTHSKLFKTTGHRSVKLAFEEMNHPDLPSIPASSKQWEQSGEKQARKLNNISILVFPLVSFIFFVYFFLSALSPTSN